MKTLIIHDGIGYILAVRNGEPAPREPIGVPFLWVEIPEGKRIKITDGIGVDVSVTPHQVILEDIPPTIEEQLSEKVSELKEEQISTKRTMDKNSAMQQELIELLIDMGVI